MESINTNKIRDFMVSNYGDEKANKKVELNEDMTIINNSPDEYTRTINNIGGNQ